MNRAQIVVQTRKARTPNFTVSYGSGNAKLQGLSLSRPTVIYRSKTPSPSRQFCPERGLIPAFSFLKGHQFWVKNERKIAQQNLIYELTVNLYEITAQ